MASFLSVIGGIWVFWFVMSFILAIIFGIVGLFLIKKKAKDNEQTGTGIGTRTTTGTRTATGTIV